MPSRAETPSPRRSTKQQSASFVPRERRIMAPVHQIWQPSPAEGIELRVRVTTT